MDLEHLPRGVERTRLSACIRMEAWLAMEAAIRAGGTLELTLGDGSVVKLGEVKVVSTCHQPLGGLVSFELEGWDLLRRCPFPL